MRPLIRDFNVCLTPNMTPNKEGKATGAQEPNLVTRVKLGLEKSPDHTGLAHDFPGNSATFRHFAIRN